MVYICVYVYVCMNVCVYVGILVGVCVGVYLKLGVIIIITLRAKLSGAVYCNRSCLCVFVCLWVCYHDNSKLRASILTKLGCR